MVNIHNTRKEIKAAAPVLGIVPISSTQQHGPHLPLESSGIILNAVAEGAAERYPQEAYLLPALPVSAPTEHADFDGTVWLRPDTQLHIIKDVAWSLREHGITKIVFINDLGILTGNSSLPDRNMAVKTAVRDLNHNDPTADYLWLQPTVAAGTELRKIFSGWKDEINGGDFETSCIMYLAPELVKGTPKDFVPDIDPAFVEATPFRKISPTGVWGYPSRATAEKGRQAVEAMIVGIIDYLDTNLAYLAKVKDRSRKPATPHH